MFPARKLVRSLKLVIVVVFALFEIIHAQAGGQSAAKTRYLVTRDVGTPTERFESAELTEEEAAQLRRAVRTIVEPDGIMELEPILPMPVPPSRAKNLEEMQEIGAGLHRMMVPSFPIARINGTNEPLDVDVAILDSGIDPSHPDLAVFHTVSLYGHPPGDTLDHGTKVAGVIAATDNGMGVVGVASGVRIWDIRVTGPPPNNSWTHLIRGMDYCTRNSNAISVANISMNNRGNPSPTLTLRLALRRMVQAGIVVVVSAGNDAWDLAGPDEIYGEGENGHDDAIPAGLHEAMAVSGMDPVADTFYTNSNFSRVERPLWFPYPGQPPELVLPSSSGNAMDVVAPGVGILTTASGGGYVTGTGTSLAAPHVTGLVALYIAANGRARNEQEVYNIRQAIINAAQPQSQWNATNTLDPDPHPEPLAIASTNLTLRPFIGSEPSTVSVLEGETAVFSIVALGTGPFRYKWLHEGQPMTNNSFVSGADGSLLTISNVQTIYVGSYQVIVSNALGAVTSAVATLALRDFCNPTPSLVASWRGEGNGRDAVGLNHGTFSDGVAFAPGKVQTAFLLDGTNGNISVPDAPLLNPANQITVEAWVNPSDFVGNGANAIVDKGYYSHSPPYYQFHLSLQGNYSADRYSFGFHVAAGGYGIGVRTSADTWSPGNWYHLVGTYDGAAVKLYTNGVIAASQLASGLIPSYGRPVIIGGFSNLSGPDTVFPGLIDEVSIYAHALNAHEVGERYTAGRGGMCLGAFQRAWPKLEAWSFSDNILIARGRTGLTNGEYRILVSTNVSLPLIEWQSIATNRFEADGSFSVTNIVDGASPQKFIRLQLP